MTQRPGRTSNASVLLSPKRFLPILDPLLKDRIHNLLWAGHFRQMNQVFRVARQAVNRHIHQLVELLGGALRN